MAMSKNEYFVENTSNKCIAFRNKKKTVWLRYLLRPSPWCPGGARDPELFGGIQGLTEGQLVEAPSRTN